MADKEEQLAAFRAYDFDGSEQFQQHLRNIELPAGSGAAAAALTRVRAKWYRTNVDAAFDPAWAAASQPTAAGATHATHSGTSTQAGSGTHSSASASARTSSPPSQGAGHGRMQPRAVQLALLQAAVLVLTLLYLQPLHAGLSRAAYRNLTLALILLQLAKVLAAFGTPSPLSLAGLQAWGARVMSHSDAHYLLLAVAAATSPPFTGLLIPYVALSAYGLAHFLSEHHHAHPALAALWAKHGAPCYARMLANQQAVLLFIAQAEIVNGFMSVVMLLFPTRRLMLTMVVWQVLRMRYWSADAAIYHRRVWSEFDRLSLPLRQRFPLLQKPVDLGVAYFNQVQRQAPQRQRQ